MDEVVKFVFYIAMDDMFTGVKVLTPWWHMCILMVEWKKLIASVAALCLSHLCQMAQDLCWNSEGYIPQDIPEVLKPPTVLQKVSISQYDVKVSECV
jgi:hypothetical protein